MKFRFRKVLLAFRPFVDDSTPSRLQPKLRGTNGGVIAGRSGANHPDALIARGLPEEAVKMAEKRMIDINRAWETLSGEAA